MRAMAKLLLGAIGFVSIAGAGIAADRVHVVDVALPDGSIGQLRYTGSVPPRVVMIPVAHVTPMIDPFGGGDPFAMLDHAAASMDMQVAAMLRQAAVAARSASAGIATAVAAHAPSGLVSYSYSSFSSTGDGKGCEQSVQMTSLAGGGPPQVVRRSSGDCSSMATRAPMPAAHHAAPAAPPSPVIPARYVPAPAPAKAAPAI